MGFFDKYSIPNKGKKKKQKLIKCQKCGNTFYSKRALERHTYCREDK